MMSQQEQLAQFVRQIMEDVNRETSALLKDADQHRRKALSEAENKLLSEAYRTIQAKTTEIKQEMGRQTSTLLLSYRKQEAQRRTQIKTEILDELKRKLSEFVSSEAYRETLRRQAQKASSFFKEGKVTVFLREQDMGYKKDLAPIFPRGADFQTGTHTLGGIIAQDETGHIVLDFSFDGRLAEVDEQFSLFVRLDGEQTAKGEN